MPEMPISGLPGTFAVIVRFAQVLWGFTARSHGVSPGFLHRIAPCGMSSAAGGCHAAIR